LHKATLGIKLLTRLEKDGLCIHKDSKNYLLFGETDGLVQGGTFKQGKLVLDRKLEEVMENNIYAIQQIGE